LENGSDGVVLSATAAPSCPGRIYVEGRDPNKIWGLCSRVPSILALKGMTLVPLHEWGELFNTRGEDRCITAQSWVRLRRGPNKGDLAYVLDASINCDHVRIAVMPRMSFTLPANTGSGKGERKRKRTPQRLAPQPFDPIEVKHVHGSDALKQKGDDYYFQKKKFREGMLIQTIQSTQTLHRVLNATLDEIKPFIWAGFVTSAAALAMASAQALASIRPGDRVAFTAGEYAGYRARVISCNDIVAVVDILDFDADNKVVYRSPFLWEVPIGHLRRSFYVGEKVYVREDAGEHAGSTGCVVVIDGDDQHLTFLEDQTGKLVSALSHLEANQRIHSNRSTSSAHLSRYTRLFINRLIFPNPDRPVSAHSPVDEFFWVVDTASKDMSDTCDPSPQASPSSSWMPITKQDHSPSMMLSTCKCIR
jgi:hypothetical protein